MPHPCPRQCGKCHLCNLYQTSPRHRAYWDGLPTPEPAPPRDGPSLLRRALNYARAAAGHALAGLPAATEEEVERRLSLCRSCADHFDAARGVCLHQKCGCDLAAKAAWQDQKCPIGRW